jgi:hypothetical protein
VRAVIDGGYCPGLSTWEGGEGLFQHGLSLADKREEKRAVMGLARGDAVEVLTPQQEWVRGTVGNTESIGQQWYIDIMLVDGTDICLSLPNDSSRIRM